MKWSLILFVFTIIACSVNRDIRDKTKTKIIRLTSLDLTLDSHFKKGDYIISISDSIGNDLLERFINLPDSCAFKNDTVDLDITDAYWTRSPIKRVIRNCIEMNDVRIYSILESKYIYKIKRTVSKSKYKDIHNRYIYTNVVSGDTILYSHSFDTGTPPF
ncbi:MAG: hypothetical protein HN704_17635 [Bacteroidetes bacterium]|jgi:hypothetical protein|nr:hypothetical protein [Bacteroidota bacterium]MBT7493423.1 hypothetical protein [Bacteroidota bacterium]